MTTYKVIQQIRTSYPDAHVIALSAHNSEEHIYQAIQAGAAAYVLKEDLSDTLIRTIHAIYSGEYTIIGDIAKKYIQRSKNHHFLSVKWRSYNWLPEGTATQ